MRVVFRVDASEHIGSGHVMRCLVLADALRAKNHQVVFVTRAQASDLNEYILAKGFTLVLLNTPNRSVQPNGTNDYKAWLQVSEQEDCDDFLSKINKAELLVIDHYAIGKSWQQQVKRKLNCKLLVIDDLVRKHCADIVLDQTLNRRPDEYTSISNCIALTGSQYALLKPRFSQLRKMQKEHENPRHQLLVTMGGIDKPNASLKVLEILLESSIHIKTTVLLSKRAPHYSSIKAFAHKHAEWVTHIDFVDDMASFMLDYSLAIGAPGSSSWERACLGIPSVVVPLAENQSDIAAALAAQNAAKVVAINDLEQKLLPSLDEIITNWLMFRRNNQALCDGLGCERVVEQIESGMSSC